MSEKLKNPSDFKSEFIYKTEPFEDVYDIAEKFGTTARIIVADNELRENPECGDLLIIEIPKGDKYIVKPTDTIQSIASKFKKSQLEIMKNNKIDEVFVGQIIYI